MNHDPDGIFAEHVELRTSLSCYAELDLTTIETTLSLTQDEAVTFAIRLTAFLASHDAAGHPIYLEWKHVVRKPRTGWFPWPGKTKTVRVPLILEKKETTP